MLKNKFFKFFAKLFSLNTKTLNVKVAVINKKLRLAFQCWPLLLLLPNCDLEFEGQILDLHDNTPISQATIQVIDSDQKVYSDDEGFSNLKTNVQEN